MHSETHFQKLVEAELFKLNPGKEPAGLYEPIRYMLNLGGKRLRPSLLLMCHELFNGNPQEVINPALGIEVFHNFTLLHDDIMDKAPLRRAQPTVHVKWNADTAILSGDTMFVLACQLMMKVKDQHLRKVMDVFLKTSIEVCEGQQSDMDFEKAANVSIDAYLDMISKKTAVLLGCSATIGGICADAEDSDATHLYAFGKNLGMAFQLHDDILDVYGDTEKFGKQIGGDILANKKTYLLLTAFQKASGNLKNELNDLIQATNFDPNKKIEAVIAIYDTLNIRHHATEKMEHFFGKAMDELDAINVPAKNKETLIGLAEKLMVRER
jgi:geranylgeranyl diphosphate synthase type II